jgi:hypothetical protein
LIVICGSALPTTIRTSDVPVLPVSSVTVSRAE